jgi:hypothetical protein
MGRFQKVATPDYSLDLTLGTGGSPIRFRMMVIGRVSASADHPSAVPSGSRILLIAIKEQFQFPWRGLGALSTKKHFKINGLREAVARHSVPEIE